MELQGNIFMRLVLVFDQWPWRTFKLAMDEVEEEVKVEVEDRN